MAASEIFELDFFGLLDRDVAGRLDQLLDERGDKDLAAVSCVDIHRQEGAALSFRLENRVDAVADAVAGGEPGPA